MLSLTLKLNGVISFFSDKICFQAEAHLLHENGLDSFQTDNSLHPSLCLSLALSISLNFASPPCVRDFYPICDEIITQQQFMINVAREKRMVSV